MDNKVKLFAVASVIAVFVSGCSGYNNQGANVSGSDGYASSQRSNSGQVGNTGYGQRRPAVANTCARPKTTYTYKPKPRVVYKPKPKVVYRPQPKVVYRQPKVIYRPQPKVVYKPRPVQQYNQQYYVDRWNRQQTKRKPVSPVVAANSTTYYDYSSAGKAKYRPPYKARNVAVSNKSIYTGSYQKTTYKPYKPKTYTVGARSTYKSNTTVNKKSIYSGRSTGGRRGNSYVVKKGDTVFEIMRQTGVYWKDIIRINHLSAPYNINPGQTIRLK